jgi:diguanylate cyclase
VFTSLLLNFCLLITSTFAISLTYRAGEARQRAVMMVVRLALTAGATLLLAMASAEEFEHGPSG